jgi:hypothetical protein
MQVPMADQQRLIEAVRALLVSEQRIEAAWLSGSIGKGEGDSFSDVDIIALVAGGTIADLSSDLAGRLRATFDPPLLMSLYDGSLLSAVTADWQRFDVFLIGGEMLPRYKRRDLTLLFNRGGREPPERDDPPYRTAPDGLLKIVNEFLRVLGLCPVVLGREEYQLALSGLDLLRRATIDLMLEENGIAPWQRGGALRRNPMLTGEQREELAGLPAQAATRESVIDAHLAFAHIFLPRARRLAAEIGMEWPARFEAATRRHISEQLGRSF